VTLILGLESSCDESAAALVTGDGARPVAQLAEQEAAHRPFGGVVPEIAARAHVEALPPLIEAALAEAAFRLREVDAVAATAGPGPDRRRHGRAGDGQALAFARARR
jgi:N6-L-threonylcarbamoyladenine synthase